MGLNMQHTTPEESLIYLLEKLVEVIRYENGYAWELMRAITLDKSAVIQLDRIKVHIRANATNGYTFIARTAKPEETIHFSTAALTLRKVLAGMSTIDKAIADGSFFIRSSFENSLNMYKLTICLLSEASVNPSLRRLWEEFLRVWDAEKQPLHLSSIEKQHTGYDAFIRCIPRSVSEGSI